MNARPSTEDVVTELRQRIRSFDHGVQPPPDLFQRVVAPRRGRRPAVRRPWSAARLGVTAATVAAAVAALVLAVSAGVGSLHRPDAARPATRGTGGLVLEVYNAERPCQSLRTIECGLGVYRDPRNQAPDQVVARVWHGDRVTVGCVVPDGFRVTDEDGVSSTRWYRVSTASGATGYLPGVRTRNTTEVALCPP